MINQKSFKKMAFAIAVMVVLGSMLALSGYVDAIRIDNRVNLSPVESSSMESGSSSGGWVFEKGDAIYRQMALPFRVRHPILRFFSRFGHAGLYWEWIPDDASDPTVKRNHKIVESGLDPDAPWWNPLKGAGVHTSNFEDFYEAANFWGVRTSNILDHEDRRNIITAALAQLGCKYNFFGGYKKAGVSFRCDGLVEYCYESVGIDIVPDHAWWQLAPVLQMALLPKQDNAFFPILTFGKEGEYEPIYIDDEPVPLEDGKYKVYGSEVEVKIYANDIDDDNDGSGITRLELWVGEMDDTPDEMPGLRLLRDDADHPADNDYTYTWNTTEKEDGEPLFPNGDYTLKAIGFDQAGNKAGTEIQVEVVNPEVRTVLISDFGARALYRGAGGLTWAQCLSNYSGASWKKRDDWTGNIKWYSYFDRMSPVAWHITTLGRILQFNKSGNVSWMKFVTQAGPNLPPEGTIAGTVEMRATHYWGSSVPGPGAISGEVIGAMSLNPGGAPFAVDLDVEAAENYWGEGSCNVQILLGYPGSSNITAPLEPEEAPPYPEPGWNITRRAGNYCDAKIWYESYSRLFTMPWAGDYPGKIPGSSINKTTLIIGYEE